MTVDYGPRCHGRAALPILAALLLLLGGCVAPHRYQETVGGKTVTCGEWTIRLTGYQDVSNVGFSAWMDKQADRAPLWDELLQVDSLVVYDGKKDRRWTTLPKKAAYKWDDHSGPWQNWVSVHLVHSRRCLGRHIHEERDEAGKVILKQEEYRLLVFDPPSPLQGVLEMPESADGIGPLDKLPVITVEELRTEWTFDAPQFELVFHPYDDYRYHHDRTLKIYLRGVDRRTAEVLWSKVFEFAQTAETRWEINQGL